MMGIPLCQDFRVRGQDFLHLVVRQARTAGQGFRPQPRAGDGLRHGAHGSGSGRGLPRDGRRSSRHRAGPTGRRCRPFPGSAARGSAARSDGCRSVCLRGCPGRRSQGRGSSVAFPDPGREGLPAPARGASGGRSAWRDRTAATSSERRAPDGPARPTRRSRVAARSMLCAPAGNGIADRLHGFPGRSALWMFQHMDLMGCTAR